MTCEEFQAVAEKKSDARAMTRGERAALVSHSRGCRACLDLVVARVIAMAAAGVDVERQLRMAHELRDEDRKDPEYRKASGDD